MKVASLPPSLFRTLIPFFSVRHRFSFILGFHWNVGLNNIHESSVSNRQMAAFCPPLRDPKDTFEASFPSISPLTLDGSQLLVRGHFLAGGGEPHL